MVEFFQNYGIWIAVIGGMFLMHRLGFGCCGSHSHGHNGDATSAEPKPTDAKAARGEKT